MQNLNFLNIMHPIYVHVSFAINILNTIPPCFFRKDRNVDTQKYLRDYI